MKVMSCHFEASRLAQSDLVLRSGNPRTVSGRERSSTKRNLPGAARAPDYFCAGHEATKWLFLKVFIHGRFFEVV